MIRRVVRSVSSSSVSSITVVVGHDADLVRREIETLCDRVTVNSHYMDGMGSSIAAGVSALATSTDAALIVLGDQPLISARHIDALVDAWSNSPENVVLSAHDGETSPPSLFPRSMFPMLKSLHGDGGAKSSLRDVDVIVLEVDSPRSLIDIDSPEDFHNLYD